MRAVSSMAAAAQLTVVSKPACTSAYMHVLLPACWLVLLPACVCFYLAGRVCARARAPST